MEYADDDFHARAHFARSTIPEVACKQAHLVRYSCEYLGGGAAVCKSATEASR